MALCHHQPAAFLPQLRTGGGVNGVVNAAVTGAEAAQHCAVCRVHNGICIQAGNVALPQKQPWVFCTGRERFYIDNVFFIALF